MQLLSKSIAVFASSSLVACVTASTPLQTATPTPKGDWSVQAGATVPVPSRFFTSISDLVDEARDRVDREEEPLNEEEERDLRAAALGLLLFQPAPVFLVGIRRGVDEDVDLGVRWAGSALRGDVKWRVDGEDDGHQFALNLAGTHHLGVGAGIASSFFELFESVKLVDYARNDVEAGAIFSSSNKEVFGYHVGARYSLSRIRFTSELAPDTDSERGVDKLAVSSLMHHVAGTGGMRFGTERFRLLVEMSVGYLTFEPDVLGEPVDLSGWIVEPGIAGSVVF